MCWWRRSSRPGRCSEPTATRPGRPVSRQLAGKPLAPRRDGWPADPAQVGFPQARHVGLRGVNPLGWNTCPVGTKKAVSDRVFSSAIAGSWSSGSQRPSGCVASVLRPFDAGHALKTARQLASPVRALAEEVFDVFVPEAQVSLASPHQDLVLLGHHGQANHELVA
jgi:hypothetical protein